jgi:hypothetical protein
MIIEVIDLFWDYNHLMIDMLWIYNNIMSISVSGHANMLNEATFDTIDFFNAWRTES